MTVLTVQIAILDAAAESLMGVCGTVRAAAGDLGEVVTALAVAAPESALATELPGVPVEHLAEVIAARGQVLAARVADGARAYRELEAALLGRMERAGGVVPVPR